MEDVSPLPIAGPLRVSLLRQSDARLVRRATAGDEAAFAAIFERYGQDLYRFCRAILGDQTDAQDAVQNTMTRILRALPREQRTINLRPWLYRVARNESLTLIREREQSVELTEERSPAVPAADISAEHREAVRTLVADLASLPEFQRSALVLHEMSGLSHAEVSEALQRSPRASRQAIYEARIALQDLKEGRAMDCDEVRAVISDGDGRVVRGRKIRSHLRDCQRCSDFALGIRQRRTLFGWLAPPLPAATASGLVASVLGGGSGAGGALGAGAVGVLGGSSVLKSIGIVGAGIAIGVGGAGVAGVDLPGGAERAGQSGEQAESSAGDPPSSGVPAGGASNSSVEAGSAGKGPAAKDDPRAKNENGNGGKPPEDKPHGNKPSENKPHGNKPPENKPHGNKPSEPPGQSGSRSTEPPVHSNAGGNSSGPPANSNVGGNSAISPPSDPPEHAHAGGKSEKDPE